ncbi:MAG: carcinine hydrolase/isopenicillin-N N-acyltransferase family protein, partial [Myxococcota bacterium]
AIAVLAGEADAALVGVEGPEGAQLWRSGPRDGALRRVQPEGRFRSIELASPALASPWIGVNESGLALAVSGGRVPARCTAHAALLARDCLERFETVESALAWCTGRPAAPGARILLADAEGELAGVELGVAGREVRRPESGVLVLGPDAAHLAKLLADRGTGRSRIESLLVSPSRVDLASRSLQASSRSSQSETAREGSSVTRQ